MNLPLLGFVLGDPTGIGPEQCARVLADRRLAGAARLLVIGDARVLERGAAQAGVRLAMRRVAQPEDADFSSDAVPVLDLGNYDPAAIPQGKVSAESGRLTGETLRYAIDLALAGPRRHHVCAAQQGGASRRRLEVQRRAPALRAPDAPRRLLRRDERAGQPVDVACDFARVAANGHRPTHARRIDEALTLADRTMRGAGFERPRIAVCALNPHAGENGLFGREEIDLIAPAIAKAAARGIACKGPYPADTVFLKAFAGEFDGVLSMYHDQGQIATKLKGFNRGVTVTAGLKTVFTTPAHGTAFDIVGQGRATTGALEQAVQLAARLALAPATVPATLPQQICTLLRCPVGLLPCHRLKARLNELASEKPSEKVMSAMVRSSSMYCAARSRLTSSTTFW